MPSTLCGFDEDTIKSVDAVVSTLIDTKADHVEGLIAEGAFPDYSPGEGAKIHRRTTALSFILASVFRSFENDGAEIGTVERLSYAKMQIILATVCSKLEASIIDKKKAKGPTHPGGKA